MKPFFNLSRPRAIGPSGLLRVSKINGTMTLCVESFSQSDIESLMAVLKNKFGLECRIEKRSKIRFRIVIKKSSLVHLREIVSPHFHNSMLYKLGL